MTKTTTNVLGIIIVILAGIYFYILYCGSCAMSNETGAILKNDTNLLAFNMKTSIALANLKTVETCSLRPALINSPTL